MVVRSLRAVSGARESEFFRSERTGRLGRFEIAEVSNSEYLLIVDGRWFEALVHGDTRFDADLCEDPVKVDPAYVSDDEIVCNNLGVHPNVGSLRRCLT